MSQTFSELLARANMTPEDLPETDAECRDELAFLAIEIEDIKMQIEGAGHDASQDWLHRARFALRVRRAEFLALKRHRNRMTEAREAERRENGTKAQVAKVTAHYEGVISAMRAKRTRLKNACESRERSRAALLALWEANHPDRMEEAYAAMEAAQ